MPWPLHWIGAVPLINFKMKTYLHISSSFLGLDPIVCMHAYLHLVISTALLYLQCYHSFHWRVYFYIIPLYSMCSVLQKKERCYQTCTNWCKTYWYGCISIMYVWWWSLCLKLSNITQYNILYNWKLSWEILHVGHVYVNSLVNDGHFVCFRLYLLQILSNHSCPCMNRKIIYRILQHCLLWNYSTLSQKYCRGWTPLK